MDRFERLAGALRRIPGLEVRENEPMKRHTTFRIGGPARLMALPRSRKEAAAAVQAATEAGIAPFFLGNGSNLLVADHGYEGFVLKACGLDQVREVNRRLRAESGITLARLANVALGRGLTGLEFAAALPELERLTVRDNYITDIKPLEGLGRLRFLDCTGNPVENYRVLSQDVTILQ